MPNSSASYGVSLAAAAREARLDALRYVPAAQQPPWEYDPDLWLVRERLAGLPSLVDARAVDDLRHRIAQVQSGAACVLHVGECAETFAMATGEGVRRRLSLYLTMADHLASRTGRNVLLVARMAGQHAKPRSQPYEKLPGGEEVLTYRGDAVNGIAATAEERRADPALMLMSYRKSHDTLKHLAAGWPDHPVFVSHEALLRDYEEPMTRGIDPLYCTTGHLVWVGERTRRLWNWHIQWARLIENPVGVKIGPSTTSCDVIDLIRLLNPRQDPGRLTFISRMGATGIAGILPSLVRAVTDSGFPVAWQCDPMHGNTKRYDGKKLRLIPDLREEISSFVRIMRQHGLPPGGLHLEVTPEDVWECHHDARAAADYDSSPPCDPRLNPAQAIEVVDHFAKEITGPGRRRGTL